MCGSTWMEKPSRTFLWRPPKRPSSPRLANCKGETHSLCLRFLICKRRKTAQLTETFFPPLLDLFVPGSFLVHKPEGHVLQTPVRFALSGKQAWAEWDSCGASSFQGPTRDGTCVQSWMDPSKDGSQALRSSVPWHRFILAQLPRWENSATSKLNENRWMWTLPVTPGPHSVLHTDITLISSSALIF